MTPSPPGIRLHKLLVRWAPPTVVRDVVEPTIADFQYEAGHARDENERRRIVRRGHVAVLRALARSIEPGGTIRAALALSALCAIGTLLVIAARAAHVDGRVVNSALLAPGMLAPLILRMLGTTSSRRLFAGSLLVAALTPAFAGTLRPHGGRVWMVVLDAVIVLVAFAPIAAAATIVARPSRETLPTRAVTSVILGSGIATAAFLVAHWPPGYQMPIGLAMTPFYIVLFAGLFALTLLPLLLVARAFIVRPVLLAAAGLICSPAPLIAASYLDHGTFTACLDALRHTPLSFAASSLPFVMGAIGVGWRLRAYGQTPNSTSVRS